MLERFAVVTILTVSVGTATAQEPTSQPETVTLAIAVTPGQVFEFHQEDTIDQSAEIGAATMKSTIGFSRDYRIEVDRVEADGTAVLRFVFGNVHGTAKLPIGKPVEFDSDDENPQIPVPIAPLVRQYLALSGGKSVEVHLSRAGKVVAVHGWRDAVGEDVTEMLDALGLSTVDAEQADEFQGLVTPLPGGPISVGGTWNHSTHVALASVDLDIECIARLDAVEADRARVSLVGTAAMQPEPASDPDDETSRKAQSFKDVIKEAKWKDMTWLGSADVDKKSGLPLYYRLEQSATVESANPLGGAPIAQVNRRTIVIERREP